jgi:hypothetical protein
VRSHLPFCGLVALTLLACSSSHGPKVSGYVYCSQDSDCQAGEVCDEDDSDDSYCTQECAIDSDCSPQVDCPGLQDVAPSCQFESQNESHSRGVCDLFQGHNGPNSCRDSAFPSAGPGASNECNHDEDCADGCSTDCYRCNGSSCECGDDDGAGECTY